VADFHSAEAATKAADDWGKQFQKDQVPEEIETAIVPFAEFSNREGDGVRLAKVLVKIGFAVSTSEADRKMKEGAVSVDGVKVTSPVVKALAGVTLTLRLGRKIKKVSLAPS
jgi:tyrosyl-tRNA synthetase